MCPIPFSFYFPFTKFSFHFDQFTGMIIVKKITLIVEVRMLALCLCATLCRLLSRVNEWSYNRWHFNTLNAFLFWFDARAWCTCMCVLVGWSVHISMQCVAPYHSLSSHVKWCRLALSLAPEIGDTDKYKKKPRRVACLEGKLECVTIHTHTYTVNQLTGRATYSTPQPRIAYAQLILINCFNTNK